MLGLVLPAQSRVTPNEGSRIKETIAFATSNNRFPRLVMPEVVVPQDSSLEVEELLPFEKWWRDHYDFFEARGYRLRPRYRPDWIPSWSANGKPSIMYEDGIWTVFDSVLDATRLSDGMVVNIKRIPRDTPELSIALFLSPSGGSSTDPRNHCIPILDHIINESVPDSAFIVMPLLRPFDDPSFYTVDEAIEFIRQTLEGLSYMHSCGVAHRDCAKLNIMMHAPSLYPDGFHPILQNFHPSGVEIARHGRRRYVHDVKYYFIDFGISTRFEENTSYEDRLVTGTACQDLTVPELSHHVPYDPFAVDIYTLGNVYKTSFLDVYTNFDFLAGLIASMTARRPKDRPSAEAALSRFDKLLLGGPPSFLHRRLKRRNLNFIERFFVDVDSVAHAGAYAAKEAVGATNLFFREIRRNYFVNHWKYVSNKLKKLL